MFINPNHEMTLTDFTESQHMSHMQKNVKLTLKGKTFRNWASGQNIYEFEKEINPRGYSDTVLGIYTCVWPLLSNKLIDVYLRSSQVSIFRTIGPLVVNSVRLFAVYV